jgi:superkiller protein 8
VLQSKQYLTTHTIDKAHPTDIFALAATPTSLFSASGSSSIQIFSTATPDLRPQQTLSGAHKLGCHHLAVAPNGRIAASAGFGGEVKVWRLSEDHSAEGEWKEAGKVADGDKAGEMWALAITQDGKYLAASAYDGRVCVWDLQGGSGDNWTRIREYETKGSFGMCVAVVRSTTWRNVQLFGSIPWGESN